MLDVQLDNSLLPLMRNQLVRSGLNVVSDYAYSRHWRFHHQIFAIRNDFRSNALHAVFVSYTYSISKTQCIHFHSRCIKLATDVTTSKRCSPFHRIDWICAAVVSRQKFDAEFIAHSRVARWPDVRIIHLTHECMCVYVRLHISMHARTADEL